MAKKIKNRNRRQAEVQNTDFDLQTMEVSTYARKHSLIFSKGGIKMNVNGYPFMPCVERNAPKGTGGHNIYFTKAAAELVEEGDTITDFSKEMQMVEVMLQDGSEEMVWKFCPKGEGNYEEVDYDSL